MALLRNTRSLFQTPCRLIGAISFQNGEPFVGGGRSRYAGGVSQFSSYPIGTLGPSAYILPQKSGGLASTTSSQSILTTNGNLIPSMNLSGTSALVLLQLNAQLDRIVSAIGSSAMALTRINAVLAGAATASATSAMALAVVDALCGAIFSVVASGQSVVTTSATATAIGHISANAGGATPLSPEGLAVAVWSSIMTDYNQVGTFGQKLKTMSDGGAADLTAVKNEIINTLLPEIKKRLKLADYLALK